MKLFEYQAKEVFKRHGIPVPKSVLIERPNGTTTGAGAAEPGSAAGEATGGAGASSGEAHKTGGAVDEAVQQVGVPCAVKAQVLSGGRGKAGLIKIAWSPEEARSAAAELFAHPEGVPRILI